MKTEDPYLVTRGILPPKGWRTLSKSTKIKLGDYYASNASCFWKEVRTLSDYSPYPSGSWTFIRKIKK